RGRGRRRWGSGAGRDDRRPGGGGSACTPRRSTRVPDRPMRAARRRLAAGRRRRTSRQARAEADGICRIDQPVWIRTRTRIGQERRGPGYGFLQAVFDREGAKALSLLGEILTVPVGRVGAADRSHGSEYGSRTASSAKGPAAVFEREGERVNVRRSWRSPPIERT